jgi:hypothetical protein
LGRAFANVALADWRVGDERREVALLTSELVTNAVHNGAATLGLAILFATDRVRIEVADDSRQPIGAVRDTDIDLATSFGHKILEQISTRWGSELRAGANVTWCELATVGRGGRIGTGVPCNRRDGQGGTPS